MPKSRQSYGDHLTTGDAFSIFGAILLISLIVGVLAYTQGEVSGRRVQFSENYNEMVKQEALNDCANSAQEVLAECVFQEIENSFGNFQTEQDLDAQQGMNFWAAVMAWLTAFTVGITAIGVWFVKRTLDATLEAVKDTGEATQAMIRQNELTKEAQRPWIGIEAELASAEASDNLVEFAFNVRFTNQGSMIAENFYGQVKLIPMSEPVLIHLKGWFDGFEAEADLQKRSVAVIPGQTFTYPAQIAYAIEHLPWYEIEGYRKDCFFMVLAMSRYRIPGEDNWRYSMQSFALGEWIDHIDSYKLVYDSVRDIGMENLVLKPFGMTRAN